MRIAVETIVAAPIADVWRAYTTPDDIRQWNAASDDWHTTAATVDLRAGGAFSSRMEAKDGSMGFDFAGTYTRVEAPRLLEYSFGDRTAQAVGLSAAAGIFRRAVEPLAGRLVTPAGNGEARRRRDIRGRANGCGLPWVGVTPWCGVRRRAQHHQQTKCQNKAHRNLLLIIIPTARRKMPAAADSPTACGTNSIVAVVYGSARVRCRAAAIAPRSGGGLSRAHVFAFA